MNSMNGQKDRTLKDELPRSVGANMLLDISEEIPHAQGKRNPSKMVGVARGNQRADTLKTILTEN